jgi:hypothetical protein
MLHHESPTPLPLPNGQASQPPDRFELSDADLEHVVGGLTRHLDEPLVLFDRQPERGPLIAPVLPA